MFLVGIIPLRTCCEWRQNQSPDLKH